MAITLPKFSFFHILLISILLSTILYQATGESADNLIDGLLVKRNNNHKPIMKEKLSKFQLYWHDIQSGSKPTSINITKPLTPSSFGMIYMIDNPLTLCPNLTRKVVGRAQGFYASASLEGLDLLMTMNFVFTVGKYKESTITILGRNAVSNNIREMPVLGGSGLFRFARGYVQAQTYSFNNTTGDAIVKYDVWVMHY